MTATIVWTAGASLAGGQAASDFGINSTLDIETISFKEDILPCLPQSTQAHRRRPKVRYVSEPRRYRLRTIRGLELGRELSAAPGTHVFYLHAVIDLFSRKLVAWEVCTCEAVTKLLR